MMWMMLYSWLPTPTLVRLHVPISLCIRYFVYGGFRLGENVAFEALLSLLPVSCLVAVVLVLAFSLYVVFSSYIIRHYP